MYFLIFYTAESVKSKCVLTFTPLRRVLYITPNTDRSLVSNYLTLV